MAIYIGLLTMDPPTLAKLNQKHHVTESEVREAFQWPAHVVAALEDHPEHGQRWIAYAMTATGREIIAALLPAPPWEGENADTWVVKTARWLSE